MTPKEHEANMANLRASHEKTKKTLQGVLLEGADTTKTRAEMAELANRIETEIAEFALNKADKERVKENARSYFVENLISGIRNQIDQRMAVYKLPPPLSGVEEL